MVENWIVERIVNLLFWIRDARMFVTAWRAKRRWVRSGEFEADATMTRWNGKVWRVP